MLRELRHVERAEPFPLSRAPASTDPLRAVPRCRLHQRLVEILSAAHHRAASHHAAEYVQRIVRGKQTRASGLAADAQAAVGAARQQPPALQPDAPLPPGLGGEALGARPTRDLEGSEEGISASVFDATLDTTINTDGGDSPSDGRRSAGGGSVGGGSSVTGSHRSVKSSSSAAMMIALGPTGRRRVASVRAQARAAAAKGTTVDVRAAADSIDALLDELPEIADDEFEDEDEALADRCVLA